MKLKQIKPTKNQLAQKLQVGVCLKGQEGKKDGVKSLRKKK